MNKLKKSKEMQDLSKVTRFKRFVVIAEQELVQNNCSTERTAEQSHEKFVWMYLYLFVLEELDLI